MVGFIPKPMQTDINLIFKDDQDITKIEINLIQATLNTIDQFRNRFNVQSITIDSSLTIDTFDQFKSTHAQSPEFQESRAHCFLRMLGLPIVQPDGRDFYTPGFDPEGNHSAEIVEQKLKIIKSYTPKIISLLNKRENEPGEILKLFQNRSTEASILIVANSNFLRPFGSQVKAGENPLDPPKNLGLFEVEERDIITEIYKNDKNREVSSTFSTSSLHMPTLLYLDPRIDFTAGRNSFSIPFQSDKTLTQFSMGRSEGVQLPRPYIEMVIRSRLAANKFNNFAGNYAQKILTFLETNTSITAKELINNINGDTQNQSFFSQSIYLRYLKLLRATVKALVANVNIITSFSQGANNQINWDPEPNINGADFLADIREVNPEDPTNKKLENDILIDQSNQLMNELIFSAGISTTNVGNSIFNNIDDIIFSNIKQEPNNIQQHKNEKENRRNAIFKKLNQAAQNIELITGESTGLGFLDILIFQAAMWILDIPSLLGLIDVRAFQRMNQDPGLKTNQSQAEIASALQKYLKELSNLYKLVENFYLKELGIIK